MITNCYKQHVHYEYWNDDSYTYYIVSFLTVFQSLDLIRIILLKLFFKFLNGKLFPFFSLFSLGALWAISKTLQQRKEKNFWIFFLITGLCLLSCQLVNLIKISLFQVHDLEYSDSSEYYTKISRIMKHNNASHWHSAHSCVIVLFKQSRLANHHK